MRVPIALPLLLASAAHATAGGVVKLDSPPKPEWQVIQADAGITTLAVGDKPAKWVLVDDGADLSPSADGKTAAFAAAADGHYRLIVVADGEVHRVKVVKATSPPQPMPPGPDPQPPSDPLVKLLQAAYDADPRQPEPKRKDLLDLAEIYRQAGTLAADPAVATAGQLVARVREAAKALGIVGLADVRKAIGAELQAVLPEDVPLTAETRKRAAEVFARVKAALEQVK